MYFVTVTDNWWLIYIKDGPRAGEVLSIGWWLPPASEPITIEHLNSGLPIPCGDNLVARKVTRDEAISVLSMMQVRAEENNMVHRQTLLSQDG